MPQASFSDIVLERTHKVRRTLIAVSLILIAIYCLPNVDFSDLSLFGIKPEKGGHDPRHLVLLTLWVLWLYHAALFTYYMQRDWKDWRSDLRAEGGHAFPELGMYFGMVPSEVATRQRIGGDVEAEWKWSKGKGTDAVEWNCAYSTKPNGPANATMFSVPMEKARSVRSRIVWGLGVIDIGVPLVLSLIALYLADPFGHIASCFGSSGCSLLSRL